MISHLQRHTLNSHLIFFLNREIYGNFTLKASRSARLKLINTMNFINIKIDVHLRKADIIAE